MTMVEEKCQYQFFVYVVLFSRELSKFSKLFWDNLCFIVSCDLIVGGAAFFFCLTAYVHTLFT